MVEAHLQGEIRLIPQDQADELELRYDGETRKPAGSFLLRIWGGRRKGSGSYYTPQEITAFLVKDALAPLVEPIITGCAQRNEDGKPVRRADEILRIKVCDPAMGSGAFLVQACRYLGEAYGRAIIAEEQRENTRVSTTELAKYKRRVAEKCLYGVDLNPLAVELAKVSLWLETLAQDRPLTFLDAHLRVGNSLMGAPLRNAEGKFSISNISILPTEALDLLSKDSMNSQTKQMNKLKAENKKQVEMLKAGQLAIFTGGQEKHVLAEYERQRLLLEESDENLSIEDAVALVHSKQDLLQSALFSDKSQIRRFKELCDLWCAIWFWPMDMGILPPSTMLYRDLSWIILQLPNHYTPHNADLYFKLAQLIAREQLFFHWELEFPEVWFDEEGNLLLNGGFDVLVGNPPWDKIKPNEREFYANYNPTIWNYQGTARKQFIAQLREDVDVVNQWQIYEKRINASLSLLLKGGLYQHQTAIVENKQTGGDPDTFKFFTERAFQLLRTNGRSSIIVPHGIQSTLGCTALRRLLLDHCDLQVLCRLDNERKIFPGVFHGQKFDLLVFAKNIPTQRIEAAFFSWEKAEVLNSFRTHSRYMQIEARLLRELNPETYTFIEFHSYHEVELVRRISANVPRLNEDIEDSWNISFTREMDMTNDSHCFREGGRLKSFGAVEQKGQLWKMPSEEWYQNRSELYSLGERVVASNKVYFPMEVDLSKVKCTYKGYLLKDEIHKRQAFPVMPDEIYVPLYEGRMVHQFDHAAKAYVSGSGRSAKWRELNFNEKEIIPHYFVAGSDYSFIGYRAGFCGVTGQGNERSLLTAMIPSSFPCGNSVPTVTAYPNDVNVHLLWVALTNSLVADWLLRLRISNNINFFVLESLTIPRPDLKSDEAILLIQATMLLTCTTSEFSDLWQQVMGTQWTPEVSATDPHERACLRAQIDAIVADLYNLTEHDFASILNTFPLLDGGKPALPDDERSFITRDMALLALFIRRGKTPPPDIVSFFSEAGVDIRQRTGPIVDLAERVRIATQELGAVAYQPSRREKEDNSGHEEILEQDELDFYDEE